MKILDRIKKRIKSFSEDYRAIGLRGLITLKAATKANRILSRLRINRFGKPIYCLIRGHRYPMIVRYGTSDYSVIKQIFIEKEFDLLTDSGFKLIIDCGAYVGYSAIYFLRKFPKARVIAIEPDLSNFEICKKNLSPYSDRVVLINSAVYPSRTGLVTSRGQRRYGGEWATRVRPCRDNEKPDIFSIDIGSVIANSGFDSVDLLKIDIERTEIPLFSENYAQWLDKVKNITIEFHDQECADVFFKALSDYNFEISRSGELTICKNIRRKSANGAK